MASMTFDLVQQLVDRSTTAEQAQLLAYLAPKLAGAVGLEASAPEVKAATWDEFFSPAMRCRMIHQMPASR